MVKIAALATAFLVGSASAFAPVSQGSSRTTALNAEKSKSLPFMNRPALVSAFCRQQIRILKELERWFVFFAFGLHSTSYCIFYRSTFQFWPP